MILRRAWILFLVVLVVGGICGCGGSSGGGNTLLPAVPFSEREVAIQSLTDAMTASGIDFDNFPNKVADLVAQVRAEGKFSDIGYESVDDQFIWAEFSDGVTVVVPYNRKSSLVVPPQPISEPLSSRVATGFPSKANAAILFTFVSSGYSNATSLIGPPIANGGYTIVKGANNLPLEGTLDDFEHLDQVGMLYLDGHGVAYQPKPKLNPNNETWLYFGSKTLHTDETETKYMADLQSKRLLIGIEPDNHVKALYMSDNYVRDHVKLAPNAFVYLNCCWNGTSDRMANALFAGGAGTVLGWSKTVQDPDAYGSAMFLFDELLGIKTLAPTAHTSSSELDWPATLAEAYLLMQNTTRPGKAYNFDSDVYGAKLRKYDAPQSPRSVVPVLKSIVVDEPGGKIKLYGDFGATPGIVVGNPNGVGSNLTITTWSQSLIELPYVSGLAEIRVNSGALRSNVFAVPTAEFTFSEEAYPAGTSTILAAHIDTAKNAAAAGSLTVVLIVDGVDKFEYTIGFGKATTAIPFANTNLASYIYPSASIVTALDGGIYNFPSLYYGYPVVYDNGDRMSIHLYKTSYGGNSGWTFADAQNSLRSFTSHVKVRVTKRFNLPVSSSTTFVAP
ncbi:MAG: hypothetical protein ACKVQS_04195 [Fimbriimonadaceae bacterium]